MSDIRPMKRKGLLYLLVLVIMAGSVVYIPTYSSLLSFSTSKKTSSRSSFLGGEQQLETIFRWFQAEIEIKAVALENRGHTVELLICRKKCNLRGSHTADLFWIMHPTT